MTNREYGEWSGRGVVGPRTCVCVCRDSVVLSWYIWWYSRAGKTMNVVPHFFLSVVRLLGFFWEMRSCVMYWFQPHFFFRSSVFGCPGWFTFFFYADFCGIAVLLLGMEGQSTGVLERFSIFVVNGHATVWEWKVLSLYGHLIFSQIFFVGFVAEEMVRDALSPTLLALQKLKFQHRVYGHCRRSKNMDNLLGWPYVHIPQRVQMWDFVEGCARNLDVLLNNLVSFPTSIDLLQSSNPSTFFVGA